MLDIRGVTKTYGTRRALDDISFSVAPGRLTGFVGANGSGKTTTMRVILGVLAADSGEVHFNGRPVTTDARRGFGYMPEERGLYPKMRVLEQIVYLGRLHGMTTPAATASARAILERLGLGERESDKVESLSLGNQQRAQIAAALVHSPSLLVLDEPFSGLDPLAVDTVAGVLAEYASTGAPILFSSHQLDIVERLCDDLVVIAGGSIRASGSRRELQEDHAVKHGGDRFELLASGGADWVREQPGVTIVESSDTRTVFHSSPEIAQDVLRLAMARGEVSGFSADQPSLAQIFREVVK